MHTKIPSETLESVRFQHAYSLHRCVVDKLPRFPASFVEALLLKWNRLASNQLGEDLDNALLQMFLKE